MLPPIVHGYMSFTPAAAILWASVWPEARELVLAKVWCGSCRRSVQIVDYTGEEKKGDVVLRGKCAVCGGPVCRVVETSEASHENN